MTYRKASPFRRAEPYRPALPFVAPGYRKSAPYRKPRSYRGEDALPGVPRPGLLVSVAAPFDPAAAAQPGPLLTGWNQVQHRFAAIAARWDLEGADFSSASTAWSAPQRAVAATALPFQGEAPTSHAIDSPWSAPEAAQVATALPIADHDDNHDAHAALPWGAPQPASAATRAGWGDVHGQLALNLRALWHEVAARGGMVALPWGPKGARRTDLGIGWPVEPPVDPSTITVPFLPVYAMIPTLEVVRLPDRTPLHVLSFSLQGDLGSWAWSFNAQLPMAQLGLVDPAGGGQPVEIEASINGYVWTFLVEGYDDNRRFGARTLTLRGRSPSALLAGPYAAPRTYTEGNARNVAQLADQELASTGWALDWDAVSWLVPANTFSYQDLTPIDAIGRLAAAIGAAVLTAPSAPELVVQPTYPVSPWAWPEAVPYAILPASILASGDGAWQGGSNANGIYVYSENAGYGALVKLTGTSGSLQLPMVVESLTVSADPARERGRHELAKAGRIKTETRTIPLFPSPAPPGLIPLGKLVEVEDREGSENTWRGQVMGVRIEAQRNGRAVTVRQVLSIERQFRE